MRRCWFYPALFLLIYLFPSVAVAEFPPVSNVFIGVLANRSAANCLKRWRPLADYLDSRVAGSSFHIVQLGFDYINQAVAEKMVDFVLVNPAVYVDLESKYNVSRALTVIQSEAGSLNIEFAGVLFCLAKDQTEVHLKDLRGASLAAVDENSLAWLALRLEMQDGGLDYRRDLSALTFSASHDQVVYEVLGGRSQFGIVRTGVLESMAQEGLIDLMRLKVVHEHGGGDVHLPFAHSTRGYPEWPLAALAHTDSALVNR
ncbi:MAG: PhnD/SsuA/transferrin family substrate-binding protein, partial [Deltaproteobacteria bacterium]|nr:PhnD/SsuA/transferrin family substrate-binding protein [Deltaproteobacteria bacterium]